MIIPKSPMEHPIKQFNVLKEALARFEGTLILVSHDREFLQGLSEKVLEFKDGAVRMYLGDIDYFLEQRRVDNLREVERRETEKAEQDKTPGSGKASYEAQKKQQSARNKLSKLESRIDALEKELAEIDVELAINYDATISEPDFFDNYQLKKKQLEGLMEEWEQLSSSLE